MAQRQFTFVAISYEGGADIENFESSESFMLFYLQNGKLKKQQYLSLAAKKLSEAITVLKDCAVDCVICKNFAPKSMAALKAAGFKLYAFTGGTDAAFRAFQSGELREM